MIKLTELMHSIKNEEQSNLISVDDWRWPDVEHLVNMGFEFGDDYTMITTKTPKLKIYKKKDTDENKKITSYFYIEEEDKDRKPKRFKTFNDVIDYFDTYSQPELDKNK
jgi:hypothetical protein